MGRLANIIVLLMVTESFAVGGGFTAEVKTMVTYQIINLAILFGLLGYLLKDKVHDFFHGRKRDFETELLKAEEARIEAEKQQTEISEKISNVERHAEHHLSKAKKEAYELKQNLIKDAQGLADKIILEAKRTAKTELERAKAELKREVLTEAIDMAESNIKTNIQQNDHSKLQDSFVEEVGAAKV